MDADRAAEQANGHASASTHAQRSHIEQADDPAPHCGWRVELHERLRHRVERQLEKPASEQHQQSNGVGADEREPDQRHTPPKRE